MPMMLLEATALGVTGDEPAAELNTNGPLLQRLETLRLEAGRRMGMGDVSNQVTPKPVLIGTATCNARDAMPEPSPGRNLILCRHRIHFGGWIREKRAHRGWQLA
jgi:hypothetical protein